MSVWVSLVYKSRDNVNIERNAANKHQGKCNNSPPAWKKIMEKHWRDLPIKTSGTYLTHWCIKSGQHYADHMFKSIFLTEKGTFLFEFHCSFVMVQLTINQHRLSPNRRQSNHVNQWRLSQFKTYMTPVRIALINRLSPDHQYFVSELLCPFFIWYRVKNNTYVVTNNKNSSAS